MLRPEERVALFSVAEHIPAVHLALYHTRTDPDALDMEPFERWTLESVANAAWLATYAADPVRARERLAAFVRWRRRGAFFSVLLGVLSVAYMARSCC